MFTWKVYQIFYIFVSVVEPIEPIYFFRWDFFIMLNHIKLRYKTRQGIEWKPYICERCMRRVWVDVHHIKSSFHWRRKEAEDWSDIILLCRPCHEWIHAHNNFDNRSKLLLRVHNILAKINWDEPSDNMSCM